MAIYRYIAKWDPRVRDESLRANRAVGSAVCHDGWVFAKTVASDWDASAGLCQLIGGALAPANRLIGVRARIYLDTDSAQIRVVLKGITNGWPQCIIVRCAFDR